MLSAIDALPSYFRLHESEAMDVSTCKTVQLMAAAHGQSNDPFDVVLDLSNLPAYRIDDLKFLNVEGIAQKDFPRRPRYSNARFINIHSRRG